MNKLKKAFTYLTGYWIHKIETLPVGTNMYVDIHKRIKYGPLECMFDVGANTGQTWAEFRRNEPGSKIYCFEPVAKTFQQLRNTTGNDRNCIIENCAFGDEAGQKSIKIFEDNSTLNSLKAEAMNQSVNSKEEIVVIDTIDRYCLQNTIQKIDFLKIDTEGYEMKVLEGAKNMLKSSAISFIYCEVGFLKENTRNTYFSDLTEWLANYDYHFFGIYQMVSSGYKMEFGNALFVHKDVFNP